MTFLTGKTLRDELDKINIGAKKMLKWEQIAQDTWRLRVFDGWLISRTIDVLDGGGATALCFVPDAEHEWVIQSV